MARLSGLLTATDGATPFAGAVVAAVAVDGRGDRATFVEGADQVLPTEASATSGADGRFSLDLAVTPPGIRYVVGIDYSLGALRDKPPRAVKVIQLTEDADISTLPDLGAAGAASGLDVARVQAIATAAVEPLVERAEEAARRAAADHGLTEAQVRQEIDAEVQDFAKVGNRDFGHRELIFDPQDIVVGQPDTFVAIPLGDVPAVRSGRTIVIAYGGNDYRLTPAELRALPQVNPGDAASNANSFSWDEIGGNGALLRLGWGPTGFLWAADQTGTYNLAAHEDDLDLEDYARASTTTQVPDARIPNTIARTADVPSAPATWAEDGDTSQIPLNKLGNAPSAGAGLSQQQVDGRVVAGTKPAARTGSATKWSPDDVGPVAGAATLTEHASREGGRLVSLEEFEASNRRDVTIFENASWRQAAGAQATAITGNPLLPAHNPDAELTLTLDPGTGFAGGEAKFDLLALRAKPSLQFSVEGMSTTNAVVVTVAGVNFYLGHYRNVLRLAASDIGDYTGSLVMSENDVEAFARKSNAAVVPLNKLPQAVRDATRGTGITRVETDDTLNGDGVVGDVLGVTTPLTPAEKTKLAGIAAGAEANVQSDWDQTDTTADDFIKNKPAIGNVTPRTNEEIQDIAAKLLTDGDGPVQATYDDAAAEVDLDNRPNSIRPSRMAAQAGAPPLGSFWRVAAADRGEWIALAGGQVIYDGAGPGLSVTQPTTDQESVLLTLPLDLDTVERGFVFFELRGNIGTRGSSDINFETPSDPYIRGQISVAALKALATYVAGGNNFQRIGAIEIDRGSGRIAMPIAGSAHDALNNLQVFIRNLGMAPDNTAQNTFSMGWHLYAALLGESLHANTSGRAHALGELDQAPSTDGYSVGNIINVAGHLQELVDDAADANVITGVAASRTGGYVGLAAFEWLPSGAGTLIRAMLPKTAVGQSPPAGVAFRFQGLREHGYVLNVEAGPTTGGLRRAAASDTTDAYAYHAMMTGERIATPAGVPFRVSIWQPQAAGEAQFVRPVDVHSADRWELLDRQPFAEEAVDARIDAKVQNWARDATTAIPASKLTNAPSGGGGLTQSQVDGRVRAGVEDWAEAGNASAIPAAKLANVPATTLVEGTGSTVTITLTDRGDWSAWTDLRSVAAVTRAGVVELNAQVQGAVNTGAGGGDRVYFDIRIVRTRGSVDTEIAKTGRGYARNTGNADRTTVNAASREAPLALRKSDTAQVGDTYKVQAQAIAQVDARTITFTPGTTNYFEMTQR